MSPTPTVSPTTVCPLTGSAAWHLYRDTSGAEGHDSCVYVYAGDITFDAALAACAASAPGSHLATTASPSSVGLLGFVRTWYTGDAVIMGCYQLPGATTMAGNWTWIDDTPNVYLNGNGGMLWAENEPNDCDGLGEKHCEDVCVAGAQLNDVPWNNDNRAGYMCEYDLPQGV